MEPMALSPLRDPCRRPAARAGLAFALACALACAERKALASGERADEREHMVRSQIEARGVADPRVLGAMRRVPRHRYVPEHQAAFAYDDRPLQIGQDQTISQPYIVAFMSEALRLAGDEKVLEIGTGSGYQAAVLAELAREVYSIEIVPALAARAKEVLGREGYSNLHLRTGDGYRGWPEAAPFDAIVLTAAPEHVPEPLVEQLADDGVLLLPLGGDLQELVLFEKHGGRLERRELLPVRFVPMTGEAQRPR